MNKLILAALITTVSTSAFANDAVKASTDVAVKVDGSAAMQAPAEVVKDAKDKVVAKTVDAAKTTHAELKDGTKVEITGDKVEVIGKDGKKTAAPDGDHALKDGTTITVKGGMIVKK